MNEPTAATASSPWALLDSVPDAMVVVGKDGRIEFVNEPTLSLFGYAQSELIGQPIEVLLPERFRDAHPGHRTGYFSDPKRRPMGTGLELFGRRKDGSEFPAEISLAPSNSEQGPLVIAAVRDVTDRKQAEQVAQAAEARLRQAEVMAMARAKEITDLANRELESFSYSVAHDLRAPLRSIDGFSQALLEDYADKLDADGRKYLAFVRESAQHMAQLIDDLLDLSRVTRSEFQRAGVDLSALARTVTARLRRNGPERRVEVVIEDGLADEGDSRLIAIVLDNLLGNAWKFTAGRDAAQIAFGATSNTGHRVYFVRDNGVGFDMAFVDKLFGVFQRLHGASEFEGTGVGLATVQRVINRHAGRVWAEGEVGRGATFFFTLYEEDRIV